MKNVLVLLATILLVQATVQAELISVSKSSFSANAKVEKFNEAINYANATNNPNEDYTGSMVIIGTASAYTFANTGVAFTGPVPNLWGGTSSAISLVKGNQSLSFGAYGWLAENSGLIPGGVNAKFLFQYATSTDHLPPFVLTLPGAGASRVGGNWIMSGTNPSTDKIVVTAYDAGDNLLGTAYISSCNVSDWANNFYGFQSSDGTPIHKIGIDYLGGAHPGVAALTFDVVPEPGTFAMFAGAMGFFGIFKLRQLRRK